VVTACTSSATSVAEPTTDKCAVNASASATSFTAAGGTNVAAETSDVVLLRHDLTLVPRFFDLSRRVRAIIRQNLWWAVAYNLVAVPVAAAGLLTPVFAAAAMSFSSLLVVLNSLRLRR